MIFEILCKLKKRDYYEAIFFRIAFILNISAVVVLASSGGILRIVGAAFVTGVFFRFWERIENATFSKTGKLFLPTMLVGVTFFLSKAINVSFIFDFLLLTAILSIILFVAFSLRSK